MLEGTVKRYCKSCRKKRIQKPLGSVVFRISPSCISSRSPAEGNSIVSHFLLRIFLVREVVEDDMFSFLELRQTESWAERIRERGSQASERGDRAPCGRPPGPAVVLHDIIKGEALFFRALQDNVTFLVGTQTMRRPLGGLYNENNRVEWCQRSYVQKDRKPPKNRGVSRLSISTTFVTLTPRAGPAV